MTDTETLDKIRAILVPADLHRNRERRDAIDAIRELLGVPEGPPVVDSAEPEPAAIEVPPDVTVEVAVGEAATITNDGSGEALPPAGEPDAPVRRGPGRPKGPRVAPDDAE